MILECLGLYILIWTESDLKKILKKEEFPIFSLFKYSNFSQVYKTLFIMPK